MEIENQQEENNIRNKNFFIIIFSLSIHLINIYINYIDYNDLRIIELLYHNNNDYNISNIKILVLFVILTLLILIIYDIIQLIKEIFNINRRLYIIIGIINIIIYAISIIEINKFLNETEVKIIQVEKIILCSLSIIPILFEYFKIIS